MQSYSREAAECFFALWPLNTFISSSKLDHYPIPKIEDLLAMLAGEKVFSKLDMSQAYLSADSAR